MTTVWTPVPKPVGTSSTIAVSYSGGDPVGMLMAITHSSVIGVTSIVTGIWHDVAKPNPLSWSNVPKAT